MGQVLGTPELHLRNHEGFAKTSSTGKSTITKKLNQNYIGQPRLQCGDKKILLSPTDAAGNSGRLFEDDFFKQLDATNLSRHFSTQNESEFGPTDLVLVIRDNPISSSNSSSGSPHSPSAATGCSTSSIKTDSHFKFEVHKQILTDRSLYFRAMLSAFRERDQPEVTLYNICDTLETMRELVAKILIFLYYDRINLSGGSVQEVILVANYFQIEDLQRLCNEYLLTTQLRKRTCISLYLSALLTGPFSLQQSLEAYILDNFEALAGSKPYAKEFVRALTKGHMIKFLSSRKLYISSEGVLFTAVLRWVGHNPKERLEHLPELLEKVHLKLMSADEHKLWTQFSNPFKNKNEIWLVKSIPLSSQKKAIRKLCSNPLVSFERVPPGIALVAISPGALERLKSLVESTTEYFDRNESSKKEFWCRRAKPHRWPKVIAVVRVYWKSIAMEYFEPRTRKWSVLSEMDCWRSCTAVASHDSTIYLLGGEETDCKSPTGSRTVNRVTKFDAEKRSWSSGTSMLLARRWAGAIVVDETLYVVGGIGGKGGTYERRLSSMESLSLKPGSGGRRSHAKWAMLAPMETQRSSHTVEHLNGIIYAVGGGDGKEWLSTAEAYDIGKNKWTRIANLKARRWKCGLVAVGDFLYAVGGMDSPKAGFWGDPLKSVERYDPTQNKWTEVAQMLEPRFGCSVVAHQGKIYVSGGYGYDKAILATTECYDPATDKWTRMGSMKQLCGFVGGALINKPFDLDDDLKF